SPSPASMASSATATAAAPSLPQARSGAGARRRRHACSGGLGVRPDGVGLGTWRRVTLRGPPWPTTARIHGEEGKGEEGEGRVTARSGCAGDERQPGIRHGGDAVPAAPPRSGVPGVLICSVPCSPAPPPPLPASTAAARPLLLLRPVGAVRPALMLTLLSTARSNADCTGSRARAVSARPCSGGRARLPRRRPRTLPKLGSWPPPRTTSTAPDPSSTSPRPPLAASAPAPLRSTSSITRKFWPSQDFKGRQFSLFSNLFSHFLHKKCLAVPS
ncbi:unnamed protein product, partial [Urochloa humidicola]